MMSIASNALRIQIQSAAKNGTLSTQGVLNANQILFDTNISTNNSNLVGSPTFVDRIVVLREGETDEEINVITAVDVDGVTCDCFHDWTSAPVSGDTYHVGYTIEDVETVTGCVFDTTKREWDFDRKLQIGQNSATFALMGIVNGQRLIMSDEGATTEALEIINGSHLSCGTARDLITTQGGHLIFSHDGNGEICMQIRNGAVLCAFDSTFEAARTAEGVNLEISLIAGGSINWGDVKLIGITAPMTKRRVQLHDIPGTFVGTVAEVKTLPSLSGWCQGDADKSVLDALAGEPDLAKVYIVVEDA